MAAVRLSGEACVLRLTELGFRVTNRTLCLTTLKKGERLVIVPDVETVDPDMLEAILRSAGLDGSVFDGAGARRGSIAPSSESRDG
jgi:hypothetical protein